MSFFNGNLRVEFSREHSWLVVLTEMILAYTRKSRKLLKHKLFVLSHKISTNMKITPNKLIIIIFVYA